MNAKKSEIKTMTTTMATSASPAQRSAPLTRRQTLIVSTVMDSIVRVTKIRRRYRQIGWQPDRTAPGLGEAQTATGMGLG